MKKVIDLFAGCGGLSVGFQQAGFDIIKAVEIDKEIALSYQHNHPNTIVYADDISNVDNTNYFSQGEADIIIGGPPCQGFSMAGARIRENSFKDDPRNYLFKHYINVVKIVRPSFFVFENVKGILTKDNGEIFKQIINEFSNCENFEGDKYYVSYKVVKAVTLGIPQKRERVIIFGSKNREIDFEKIYQYTSSKIVCEQPHFFDNVNVWDAISNIPEPTDDGIVVNPKPNSNYQNYLHSSKPTISNHLKPNHSALAIARMQKIKVGENFTSLDEDIKSVHSGAYGRLSQNEPAPTIVTRFDTPSGGKFIHPLKDRTLTPREAARIQSFPDDFDFLGSKSCICKQIGNAVPPKLAFFLANIIKNLNDENI